ncbi:hypothetical protein [Anaerovorax odorimutans]|uniref:hypothetical protein n=1 Tax=Anaerovorax odorimutans TaxID=109327 RepID=UPI0004861749|nr:hypothetical protein [Anaerovorax odorimutans]
MKKYLITAAIIAAATIICVKVAYMQRGYFSIGGEWFLWTIPLLWKAINYEDKEVSKNEVI